jgi:polysaccharide export outer membrane protein
MFSPLINNIKIPPLLLSPQRWGGAMAGLLHLLLWTKVILAQSPPLAPNAETPIPPNPTFGSRAIPPKSPSPPAFNINTSGQFNLYRLSVGDSVSVTLPNFPEFNFSSAIDPEGKIQVPILGRVSAVGLSLDELQNKLSFELGRRYLVQKPEVVASLAAIRPVDLTVIGEIFRPGYYNVGTGTPLNVLIAQAGGATGRADLRSVIVRRPLVDGTVLEEKFDLYTPLLQGKNLPQFRLQGGDTVIISRLETGRDQDYDQQFIARSALAQPTIIVRVMVPLQPSGIAISALTLPNGSTFLDAIGSLPPTVPLITKSEVALLRFDPEQGKVISQGLNPIDTVGNLDVSQYVALRNEDVIVVSRTLLGNVLSYFNTLLQPVFSLLNFTNRINNLANGNFFNNNNNNNNNNNFF